MRSNSFDCRVNEGVSKGSISIAETAFVIAMRESSSHESDVIAMRESSSHESDEFLARVKTKASVQLVAAVNVT
jgi:hypothetical protein